MVIVESYDYDSGKAGGDGNLSKLTQYVDATESRVTINRYDYRDRRTSTDGEIDFWEGYTLDNLDRVIRVDQRNTTSNGKLVRRSDTNYDSRGRAYRTLRYAVKPETGKVGRALANNTWFDPAENVVKQSLAGVGAFTKSSYDGTNRVTAKYLTFNARDSVGENAGGISDDIVIEQSQSQYDAAGNIILTIQRARYMNATGSGELNEPTGAQPNALVTYEASWPDALGRNRLHANYGTNNNTPLTRPALPPMEDSGALLRTTEYNNRGEVSALRDSAGRVNSTEYDDAGRNIRLVVNVVQRGDAEDANLTTHFTYSPDGTLASQTVENNKTGDQTTLWEYGTTLQDSGVASSLLLRSKKYPNGSADTIAFTYNRQNQQSSITDQRGTVHVYDYDGRGRILHDRVIVIGGATDPAIRRIESSYDVRGLLASLSSGDDADHDRGES